MKPLQIVTKIDQVQYEELSADDKLLVDDARQATFRSYAPYSHFHVGAAIRLDNGVIVTGSNQENVAYSSGTCAERTTCFYAHSQYPDARFETIAIAARDTNGMEIKNPISPCGACRQSLIEYEVLGGKDVRVILVGSRCIYILKSLKSLLPLSFVEFE